MLMKARIIPVPLGVTPRGIRRDLLISGRRLTPQQRKLEDAHAARGCCALLVEAATAANAHQSDYQSIHLDVCVRALADGLLT